jgi:hypothetical protein
MTVLDIPATLPRQRGSEESTTTVESERVAELRAMIQSGRYSGYLAELTSELEQAKAARAEIVGLTATSTLAG